MNSDERIVVQHGETLQVRGDSLRIEVWRPVFRGSFGRGLLDVVQPGRGCRPVRGCAREEVMMHVRVVAAPNKWPVAFV